MRITYVREAESKLNKFPRRIQDKIRQKVEEITNSPTSHEDVIFI